MKSFYISMLQKFSNGIKHVGLGQILFLILSSQTFENLIHGRNYFSGQLNSFLLKEIGLRGKLLPEEAISILSLHLIYGSCLMFATPKQCTMNSPNHNPKYNLLRVWKGHWSRFLKDTLHYYSPHVGSSFKYFKFQNHWLWDKGKC